MRPISCSNRNINFESRCEVAGDVQDQLRQVWGIGVDRTVRRGHDRHVLPAEARAAGRNFTSLESRLVLAKLRSSELPAPNLRKELSLVRIEATRAGFRLLAERAARTPPPFGVSESTIPAISDFHAVVIFPTLYPRIGSGSIQALPTGTWFWQG